MKEILIVIVSLFLIALLGCGEKVKARDSDGDGKMDRWSFFVKGMLQRSERDTNFDGVVDIIQFVNPDTYTPLKMEFDTNYDGEMDMIWEFDGGEVVHAEVDTDFDGRMDKTFNDVHAVDKWLRKNRIEYPKNVFPHINRLVNELIAPMN